MLLHEF